MYDLFPPPAPRCRPIPGRDSHARVQCTRRTIAPLVATTARVPCWKQDVLEAYLDEPGRYLPTLNAVNGSHRQQRRLRRRKHAQLRAMLSYLALASQRIGIPQRDGGFMSFTLSFLARHACRARWAERGMRDLLHAGLVTAQQGP